MKIGDLAKLSGLTTHTLRYYERIGLLPRVFRGPSKQREYDDTILPWIEFVGHLRTTGMPIRDMVRYAGLRSKGAESDAERRAILVRHRQHLRRHLAELQKCLSVLDSKIARYGEQLRRENTDEAGSDGHREPLRPRSSRTC